MVKTKKEIHCEISKQKKINKEIKRLQKRSDLENIILKSIAQTLNLK